MQSSQPVPELPTLDAEIYCLNADCDTQSVLASLVVDHALLNDGPVYWIDSLNHAATDPIAAVAPSPRILDRIQVARGFTPYQHASITEALLERAETDSPSLVVAPAIDALYRESMTGIDGNELLAQTVAQLTALKRAYDCPILLTTTRDDELSEPVAAAVTAHLDCEHTAYGPRFVSDDFETLVYPVGSGHVQTTIAYWQSIIDARKPLYGTYEEPSLSGRSTA